MGVAFEWLFVPGLLRKSPEIAKVWTFTLYGTITLRSDLRSRRGLKRSSSSHQKLSNGVSQSTCMHRCRVNSQLLMVRSQTANLTPDLSFSHNYCCTCLNGSCKPILDIYTSIAFQWYKERPNARCFDPCNWTLNFWESLRTPKSPFRECESHPHTILKVGLQHM